MNNKYLYNNNLGNTLNINSYTNLISLNNKDNDSIKYKALKIWVIITVILTLIFGLYWYCNYEIHPVAYYDSKTQNYLRSHTCSYPPPLTSFMDPPDVFNKKYIASYSSSMNHSNDNIVFFISLITHKPIKAKLNFHCFILACLCNSYIPKVNEIISIS